MRIEVKPVSASRSASLGAFDSEALGAAIGLLIVMVFMGVMGGMMGMMFDFPFMTGVGLAVATLVFFMLLFLAISRLVSKQPQPPLAIEVGGEGVLIHYKSGPLMLPMKRIVHLLANDHQLTIKARGLESVVVATGSSREARFLRDEFNRLRSKHAVHRADKALSIARRATAAHSDRVAHLARAAGSQNNYRNTALSPDDLAALLASAKTPPHHRIAAADALLRVAPELAESSFNATRAQTLNQPLRVALTELERGSLQEAVIEEADDWFSRHAMQAKGRRAPSHL